MHALMLKEIIETCRQRQREGDHQTVAPFPVEQLEDAIVELATPPAKAVEDDIAEVVRIYQKDSPNNLKRAIASLVERARKAAP